MAARLLCSAILLSALAVGAAAAADDATGRPDMPSPSSVTDSPPRQGDRDQAAPKTDKEAPASETHERAAGTLEKGSDSAAGAGAPGAPRPALAPSAAAPDAAPSAATPSTPAPTAAPSAAAASVAAPAAPATVPAPSATPDVTTAGIPSVGASPSSPAAQTTRRAPMRRLDLTDEQRQIAAAAFAGEPDAPPAEVVDITSDTTVGNLLPDKVPLRDVPADLAAQVPELKGMQYVKLPERALVVNPANRVVVADIEV